MGVRYFWLVLLPFLVACSEEPQVRSVVEFMSDRSVLDSTLSRCNENREMTRDDAECSNARRAVERLWRIQEKELKQRAAEEFERKRELLRLRHERQAALQRAEAEAEAAKQADLYGGTVFEDTARGDTRPVAERLGYSQPFGQSGEGEPAVRGSDNAVPVTSSQDPSAAGAGEAPGTVTYDQASIQAPAQARDQPVASLPIETEVRQLETGLSETQSQREPGLTSSAKPVH